MMRTWAIVSISLGAIAAGLTILGGMLIAFDDSLWPVDGYVLYAGQSMHLVTCAYSGCAVIRGLRLRTAVLFSRLWFAATVLAFVSAAFLLVILWPGFFVYGAIPR